MPKRRLRISQIGRKCDLPPIFFDRSTLDNYCNCPFMADAVKNNLVQDISKIANVGQEGHKIIAEVLEDYQNAQGDM